MTSKIVSRISIRASLLLASIIVSAMCTLPLMRAYSGGTESCTLLVRGFNLMRFSAWGVFPLLTTLLVPAIVFGHQSNTGKEIELLLFYVASMVCYVHAFNAAHAWLLEVSDSLITYSLVAFILPLGFTAVWLIARYCVVTIPKEDKSLLSEQVIYADEKNTIDKKFWRYDHENPNTRNSCAHQNCRRRRRRHQCGRTHD